MTWVYLDNTREAGCFTVGHYAPDGKFVPESDHGSPEAAAGRVHFLNGRRPGRHETPASDDLSRHLPSDEDDETFPGNPGDKPRGPRIRIPGTRLPR